jgi:uncharacterized protein (TIGR01777 family)
MKANFFSKKIDHSSENQILLHSLYSEKKLNFLITGSSGFVGQELTTFLQSGGHQVIKLVRNAPKETNDNHIYWNQENKTFSESKWLEKIDVVVHLAGANIAEKKWTPVRKKELIDSRVHFTKDLCSALRRLPHPPKTFISASGTGIYGNREKNEILTEESLTGKGFLADLAKEWELASSELKSTETRIVYLRLGIILSKKGGMIHKLLLPFKSNLGATLGNGEQIMPWISLEDVLGAILFCSTHEQISGPVNCVSPYPTTNQEFTKTLAHSLNRISFFKIPKATIKLLFGQMGEELLLASQNVIPKKLMNHDYKFIHEDLKSALK